MRVSLKNVCFGEILVPKRPHVQMVPRKLFILAKVGK